MDNCNREQNITGTKETSVILLNGRPFSLIYDDDPAPEPDPKPPEPETKTKVKFDPAQQAYVNSLIAEEKRKNQQKTNELITQLETQRNLASTSAAERAQLEERIEGLRSEHSTKEELHKKDTDKKLKDTETKAKQAESDAVTWRSRYERKQMHVDLSGAAVAHNAFNANQVVTILAPNTRVVEEVGEDGKPTGEFITKVKIVSKDKDGKPIVLDLVPNDAVKQMTEMAEYGNLFLSSATGGLGSGTLPNKHAGTKPNVKDMSTEEYIANRKKEKKK